MPRVEWSPAGGELLTCVDGTLRRHETGGGSTVIDGPQLLDARWRADGSIVAIDGRNRVQRYAGGTVEQLPSRAEKALAYARIATSDHYLARDASGLFIGAFSGAEPWRDHNHDLRSDVAASVEIAGDARVVAFAYETSGSANFSFHRLEGRGWQVIDTRKNRVTDRRWTAIERVPHKTLLAFDAAGRRIAIAMPEAGPSIGTIRVGKDERYPTDHLGGARAVALDTRGILAAYAYPRAIAAAPRRLRVDYLEPGVKPASRIAILDTLWIDPDSDDIVALAFDRTSRRIACLDASGAIDIVPVP